MLLHPHAKLDSNTIKHPQSFKHHITKELSPAQRLQLQLKKQASSRKNQQTRQKKARMNLVQQSEAVEKLFYPVPTTASDRKERVAKQAAKGTNAS